MEWTNKYPTKPGYYWVYCTKTDVQFVEHFLWITNEGKQELVPTTMYENYYKTYNSNNEVYLYGPIKVPDTPYLVEDWYPNEPEAHRVIKVPKDITDNFRIFATSQLSHGYVGHTQEDHNNYYIFDNYDNKYVKDPLKYGDYIVEELDGYIKVYSESDFFKLYHKRNNNYGI